jgi:FHS family Na+ dependent glucose MFS transporter 1
MSTAASSTAAQANDRRARLTKTFAYYTAFIVLGFAASVTGPTLNGLSQHTHSTIDQISYLFVLRSLGYMSGSLLAGRLYDRVKGHPLMGGAVLLIAAMMFLVPVVTYLWLLALVVLLLGTAEGLTDVGGNTLLMWVHRDDIKTFMNGLHFFFGLGALVSPIIVGLVLERTQDIYWAYWMLAALMIPGAVWLFRLPSPSPIVTKENQPARTAAPVLVALLALFMFLYVGAEVSYGGYVSKYALDSRLAPEAIAAYLASAFWGALTAGRFIGIPLSTRFSPRKILLADLLIVLAGMAVVMVMPGSLAILWLGTVIVGMGMASIFPTVLILAEQNMTITASVTSWFFVGSSLGGMVLPWLIGQLFPTIGPHAMAFVITITVVLNLILFFVVTIYTQRMAKA